MKREIEKRRSVTKRRKRVAGTKEKKTQKKRKDVFLSFQDDDPERKIQFQFSHRKQTEDLGTCDVTLFLSAI